MAKDLTTNQLEAAMGVLTDIWPDMFICLLVAPFNPGISNYISNGSRKDVITALRETADRLEKNQDNPRKG